MTLASTFDLMADARQRGSGVAAFNVLHLETVEALIAAAERAHAPLILQISENCVRYHGALEPLALATMAGARTSTEPIAVHLDHAQDADLAVEAVDLGFSSVMFDGAHLDFAQNVSTTRQVVSYAHERGIFVEAELGEVGGKDGAHAPGVRTDPSQARDFVEATGVDALAVAVGSSHAMVERTAKVDLELISRLRDAVPVPLVLHGSSGVPDALIHEAIRAGIVKVNVSTQLNKAFTAGVRGYLEDNESVVDSRKYLGAGRESMSREAERLLRVIVTA